MLQERWEEEFKMEQLKKRMAREREEREEEFRIKEEQIKREREMRESQMRKRNSRINSSFRFADTTIFKTSYTSYASYSSYIDDDNNSKNNAFFHSSSPASKWESVGEDIKSTEEDVVSDLNSSSHTSFDVSDNGTGDCGISDNDIPPTQPKPGAGNTESQDGPSPEKRFSYHRTQSNPNFSHLSGSNHSSKDRERHNNHSNDEPLASNGKKPGDEHSESNHLKSDISGSNNDAPDMNRTPRTYNFSSFFPHLSTQKSDIQDLSGSQEKTSPIFMDTRSSRSTGNLAKDEFLPNDLFKKETDSLPTKKNGCVHEQHEWDSTDFFKEAERLRKAKIEEERREKEKREEERQRLERQKQQQKDAERRRKAREEEEKREQEIREEERQRLERKKKQQKERQKFLEKQQWEENFAIFVQRYQNNIEGTHKKCCERCSEEIIKPDINAFRYGFYEGFKIASESGNRHSSRNPISPNSATRNQFSANDSE